MSVNVSSKQLQHKGIVRHVDSAIHETGIAPGCVRLELTESALFQDLPRETMKSLKRL